jgi:hypothetical protein
MAEHSLRDFGVRAGAGREAGSGVPRPGMSQSDGAACRVEIPERQLHRQVVEIRDAVIDPRVSFELNEHERALSTTPTPTFSGSM